MARRDEIKYVQFYTAGSAAHLLANKPEKKKVPEIIHLKPEKQIVIKLDPVAVLGTVVAVVMLVCMLIGFAQVNRVNDQIVQAETQLSGLKAQHSILENEYKHGYNLEEIRVAATAMGMVPKSQVAHIAVSVPPMVEEVESTWWENLVRDVRELFA